MGNRNIIILGGVAFIILLFVFFLFGRAKLTIPVGIISKPQPVARPRLPQGAASEMNVLLAAQNNSGESGVATLEEIGERVVATLYLTGYTPNVSQPAHIHMGACPEVGVIKHPLNSVVNGKSTTVLSVSLAQLKQQMPLAINVHESSTDLSTYTSCGSL